MENTNALRQPRSLIRRLIAPLGLSVAVLGGGGGGAYYFLNYRGAEDVAASLAHSAPSTSEDLKQLFASSPPRGNTTTDRYTLASSKPAAEFAELVATTSQPEKESAPTTTPGPSAPLKATAEAPVTLVGDRYGSVAIQTPTLTEQEPVAAEPQPKKEPVDDDLSEVARGQEPEGYNPLRASLEKSDSSARPLGTPQAAIQQSATAREMFGNSQPLAQQATSDARYVANQNSPAAPEDDYGPNGASTASQQAAPGYDLPQQSSTGGQNNNRAASTLEAGLGGPGDITPTPGLTNTPGTGRPGERLLEGVQNPSVTIQKLAPEEIQVGKRCTFAIRVQNTGQRTAQNVKIHDEVPLGTELAGTAPRASVSGSQLVWDIGTLSVGEERTVEVELIPTEEGELGSVATVTIATQASAKARCTKPELALRLSCKPQVHAGQQHLVQIEVTNPGSGVATGVMLLETVPKGVSHEAGPALEFEVGTLRPGESRRLELVLSAEEAGKISNVMTARADASLQVQGSCEFEIIAPELQLSVEGPKVRYLERPATYHVTINNPGTAAAKEVQLITQLPKGLQFVSANNMGEYDSGSHSVHWSLAELPANERGTVELVALPVEAGEHTLQIATKARQGLEDRTEAHVTVDGIVALMFEVVDVESPIEIGGETTYEIRVVNQGSKVASNVQVAALMPQGMRAISGQGESRHTIQGERVIFAPLPQLAPKAESVFRIHAQGLRAGDQRVRVQVTSDEVQQPITKEVSTRVYADQ